MLDRDLVRNFMAVVDPLTRIAEMVHAQPDQVATFARNISDPAAWMQSVPLRQQERRRLSGAINAERGRAQQDVEAAEARLDALRNEPAPLLGSRQAQSLADEVQQLERTIDESRSVLAEIDQHFGSEHTAADFDAKVTAGLRRVLPLVMARLAGECHRECTAAIQEYRAIANNVLRPLERFDEAARLARQLAGDDFADTTITFKDRSAWEAVRSGRAPEIFSKAN